MLMHFLPFHLTGRQGFFTGFLQLSSLQIHAAITLLLSTHFQTLLCYLNWAKRLGAGYAALESTEALDQVPSSRLLLLDADSNGLGDPGS